jgi:Fe-Mn family superoxide dismutase
VPSGARRRQTKEIAVAFQLPELAFARDALLPIMSPETLEFHHDKHHAAYVENGNKLLAGSGLEDKSLEEVVKAAFGKNAGLFNNAAQVYNHNQFWLCIKPGGGGRKLPGALAAKIDSDLGGFDKFRETFLDAAKTQFGSGWAWLSMKDGKLEVTKTSNAENPLVHGAMPLLTTDVWEHAYYIDYRNARPKYLEAWFDSLINWEYVESQFEKAR